MSTSPYRSGQADAFSFMQTVDLLAEIRDTLNNIAGAIAAQTSPYNRPLPPQDAATLAAYATVHPMAGMPPDLAATPSVPWDGAAQAVAPQTWTPAPGKTGPAWCYPNPALTPGKANPLVTQDTISTTIQISGWTATVRPPVSVTSVIKQHIMQRDNLPGTMADYELDHWWPIEAGGAVCDMDNFWNMPYAPFPGAREKDHVENWLKSQIVSGAMTLDQAHAILNDDWFACYTSLNKMGLLPMMVAYDPDGSSDPDDNA